jgi:hypothetical protein
VHGLNASTHVYTQAQTAGICVVAHAWTQGYESVLHMMVTDQLLFGALLASAFAQARLKAMQ